MDSRIKGKTVLLLALFFVIGPSHASFVVDSLNPFEKAMGGCGRALEGQVRGAFSARKRIEDLTVRLDQSLKKDRQWLYQTPALLKSIHEFRERVKALLDQGIVSHTIADVLQKDLNDLVLPWVLWKSRGTARRFFVLLQDTEKDFHLRGHLKEWAERSLGRELSEKEAKALEAAYEHDEAWDIMVEVEYFTKQNRLKEAGFSEAELDQLGRKTTLRGHNTVALQVPGITSQESRLKMRGWTSAYTKGTDETEGLMAVKQLEEKKVNPYATHVPYLARKLMEYFGFMEEGRTNSTQREQFELLRRYMNLLMAEEGVTYEKFLALSFRMADILSTQRPYTMTSNFVLPRHISDFPETIALPTTVGKVGLTPLNDLRDQGIEPIALVNKPDFFDGQKMQPIGAVSHDIVHIFLNKINVPRGFYYEIKKRRGGWSVRKAQNVDLAYHILTHESSSIFERGTFLDRPEEMERAIKTGLVFLIHYAKHSGNKRGLKWVMDLSVDSRRELSSYEFPDPLLHGLSEAFKRDIQIVVDDFMAAYHAIQGEAK